MIIRSNIPTSLPTRKTGYFSALFGREMENRLLKTRIRECHEVHSVQREVGQN